ncbi:MAG: FAD-binding protein [Myxococcales bacterium]|nr:FAD-binding protein [Myxococcales bacterium]
MAVGGVTRRELLTAMLGAPFAAAACHTATRPSPLPPGELVGPSDKLGHRLRDLRAQPPAPTRRERAAIVIVGGGVAGLSAAWRLARAGVTDFVVVELEREPGGTARAGRVAGQDCPLGAHYLVAPFAENRALVTLLSELGAVTGVDDATGEPQFAEEQLVADPEERVFYKGRWYEGLYLHAGASADDQRQLTAFRAEVDRWVAFRDARGRRAFTVPVAACSDDAEVTALDRSSMAEWLAARSFTSPRLRWLVDYACRDDFGATAAQTSAWAGLFYFAARMPRPGDDSQPLLTWPEGNGRLVAQLARAATGRLRTGLAVVDVEPGAPGGEGARLTALDAAGELLGLDAEQVIFAAPQFVAGRALRPFRAAPPAHLREFTTGAWMVANVAVPELPGGLGFPLAWDNVLYESPSLGYVVATHQQPGSRGPTVLTYYHPLCDDDPRAARSRLLALGRDEWAEVALADLSRAHPGLREQATRVDVARWGHAMVRPSPGFLFGGARAAAARPVGRVRFAHSDLSGVALFEEAFYQGVRAAEEVLAERGVASPSLL